MDASIYVEIIEEMKKNLMERFMLWGKDLGMEDATGTLKEVVEMFEHDLNSLSDLSILAGKMGVEPKHFKHIS